MRGVLWVLALGACGFRASASGDSPGGAGATDAPTADAPSGDAVPVTRSCAALRTIRPSTPSGTYMVDPDGTGPGAPFPVQCDMTSQGGGWTLVGRELPFSPGNKNGSLRYLGVDSMNPGAIANGSQSGVIGARFRAGYDAVMIQWAGTQYLRFNKPSFEMFSDTVDTSVDVNGFQTNDDTLRQWIPAADARVCVAASMSGAKRPGDTSWAIKPRNDGRDNCGCNDPSWAARGAFYGGSSDQTACTGWGGGWAGPKDDGEAKGGIAPGAPLLIWVH